MVVVLPGGESRAPVMPGESTSVEVGFSTSADDVTAFFVRVGDYYHLCDERE